MSFRNLSFFTKGSRALRIPRSKSCTPCSAGVGGQELLPAMTALWETVPVRAMDVGKGPPLFPVLSC